jgi:hypothetical protein
VTVDVPPDFTPRSEYLQGVFHAARALRAAALTLHFATLPEALRGLVTGRELTLRFEHAEPNAHPAPRVH